MMQRQKENVAAQALLGLNLQSNVTSDNVNAPSLSSDQPDSSDKETGSVDSMVAAHNESKDSAENSDSEDVPLSELKEKLKLKGKPYFKTTSYELYKYKCERIFKCLNCEETARLQKKINEHYRDNHGRLTCGTCNKSFNTLSALWNHGYEHSDKAGKYPCEDCEKSFPFPSQLKSHHKVHLTALENYCLHCTKSFKNKGKLTKHQSVHTNEKWKCQSPNCAYVCNDTGNLKAHRFSHGNNTRYVCSLCNKGFNHYMQIKCHKNKCTASTQ